MTWSAVTALHLAAAAAVVGGLATSVSEPAREGGLLLISLFDPEPIAPAGEAPAGADAGAGVSVAPLASVAEAPVAPAAPAVAAPVAPVIPEARAPASVAAPVTPVAIAPRLPRFEPPTFLAREEPAYPARARRAGSEGRVVLRVAISAAGEVTGLEVVRSSGSVLLDEAAAAAARASRFTPARRDGVAEPSEAEAAYRFELR